MSASITAQQIINHRAARKAAGLVGCVSGRPVPEMDFFGYRDVQIWNRDAQGRLNGDPDFNRKDPYCFCFDCRGAFDPKAEVDLELVQSSHARALEVYGDLFPPSTLPTEPAPTSFRSFSARVPDVEPVLVPPPINTSLPSYGSFGNISLSLPAPRHRDVMNESRDERFKNDLAERRANLYSKLVPVMDKMRRVTLVSPDEVQAFTAAVRAEEDALWRQIDAIDVVLTSLRIQEDDI